MSSSVVQIDRARAQQVEVTDESLIVELTDGRTISAPLAWYPRLLHGNASERSNWRLIGSGEGIHWPDLDEDLSIESLIGGIPSGESGKSLSRWLQARKPSRRRLVSSKLPDALFLRGGRLGVSRTKANKASTNTLQRSKITRS